MSDKENKKLHTYYLNYVMSLCEVATFDNFKIESYLSLVELEKVIIKAVKDASETMISESE